MTMTTVDDLHAAEDMIGDAASALDTLLSATFNAPRDTVARLRAAFAALDTWCRPSCGWQRDGECASGEDDCGCTCGHGEEDPAPAVPGTNEGEATT